MVQLHLHVHLEYSCCFFFVCALTFVCLFPSELGDTHSFT